MAVAGIPATGTCVRVPEIPNFRTSTIRQWELERAVHVFWGHRIAC